jgi:hypothetical protein
LREKETSFFNISRNTSLKTYLQAIFIDTVDWSFDRVIRKDILLSRGAKEIRRFRPDAVSESLNLIVEFDGVQHYHGVDRYFTDKLRDEYFQKLGYKTVRIPYYIQLSKTNIKHLFNIDSDVDCKCEYSFFDSPDNDYGLSISPLAMSIIGNKRFKEELYAMPQETIDIIKKDLELVSKANRYELSVL